MQLFYGTCLLLLLVIVELIIIRRCEKHVPWKEIVTNLNSGHIVLWIFRGLEVIVFTYFYRHFSLRLLDDLNYVLVLISAFIIWDFCFYWLHRIHHNFSFFWKVHQVHHQGEHFSLSLGVRNSWYSSLTSIPFFIPLAIIGFAPEIFVTVGAIHYFIQFYNHNRIVRNSGWLDYIFITPSHHRVHHGLDDIYINKNFGGTFVIWDKYFGTFQKELKQIPELYGLNKYTFDEDIVKLNNAPFYVESAIYEGTDTVSKPKIHEAHIVILTFLLFLLLLVFIKNESVWPFNQLFLLFSFVTGGTILLGKINFANLFWLITNTMISCILPFCLVILFELNNPETIILSAYIIYSVIINMIIFAKWISQDLK